MKYRILIYILFLFMSALQAQKEIVMSQYMYNKYCINPGFAGSHNVLSTYASFRKQWVGFDQSPNSSFFSAHTPLKNEKIALGLQLFGESYGIATNTGFSGSYTYRIFNNNKSTLAIGISAGITNFKSNWSDVKYADISENYIPDATFGKIEQSSTPTVGFGASLYSDKYFAGFSIPTFIYYNRYNDDKQKIDLTKIDYLFTGGYLHKISDLLSIQPSALLSLNMKDVTFFDISTTAFINNTFMLGTSYRSTNEIIGILGYQINQQFRFTYSIDFNISSLGTYNNGTHEVAIQFDFGYKIQSPNPKFF